MGASQSQQVITQDDLKLIEGFIEDFLGFSRSHVKNLYDIVKKVDRRFDEATESLKSMKAKVKFRANLKSKILDFESRNGYMLEASLKDSKTKLYLTVHIPLVIAYNDKTRSPGLIFIELFKSYPGQLTGGVLKSLSPIRRDEYRGEAVDILLMHVDAPTVDREKKLLALLLASNPALLGLRDNVILLCNYNRGKFVMSRTTIYIYVYYRNKEEWHREYEHTEQVSCIDLFPHLNLEKISSIQYKIGSVTISTNEKERFAIHVDGTASEGRRDQSTM